MRGIVAVSVVTRSEVGHGTVGFSGQAKLRPFSADDAFYNPVTCCVSLTDSDRRVPQLSQQREVFVVPAVGDVLTVKPQRAHPRTVNVPLPGPVARCLQEESGLPQRLNLDESRLTALHRQTQLAAAHEASTRVVLHPRFGGSDKRLAAICLVDVGRCSIPSPTCRVDRCLIVGAVWSAKERRRPLHHASRWCGTRLFSRRADQISWSRSHGLTDSP